MTVITMHKTNMGVVQYDDVTNIAKSGTTITISYGVGLSTTVSTNYYDVFIIKS